MIAMLQDTPHHPGNILDSCLCPLLHMAAGMEIIHGVRDMGEPGEVVAHRTVRKIPQIRVFGTGIQRIGSMRQNTGNSMSLCIFQVGSYVF